MIAQAHAFQLLQCLRLGIGWRHPQDFGQPNSDIPQGSEVIEQQEILEHHADMSPDFVGICIRFRDLFAIQANAPGVRPGKQVKAAQQSALACSARPYDHNRVSFPDF